MKPGGRIGMGDPGAGMKGPSRIDTISYLVGPFSYEFCEAEASRKLSSFSLPLKNGALTGEG
jgi:hypothetical protein